jgi:threonine dehydratase
VDEIVTVDEEEIASAILQLLEKEKMLAEGAGRRRYGCRIEQKKLQNHGKKLGRSGQRREYRCIAALADY